MQVISGKDRLSFDFTRKNLLPPKNKKFTYTLVLDLDETLVHFDAFKD